MTGPSHEPLDEQERELARILRALPGAEPPAALDQRILRAAADAAASSRRPVRRWLAFGGAGWGIGSAAAAVLALGVGWHLLDPSRELPMERVAPAPSPALEAPVTVDLGPPSPAAERAAPAAAPVVEAPAPPRARAAPRNRREPDQAPAFAAPPPPPPPPVAATAQDAASALGQTAAEAPAASAQPSPAAELEAAAAARQEAAAGNAADALAFDRALEARRRAKSTDSDATRRAAVTPAAWLAQVRALRDANRRVEAAESLRRFQRNYPRYAIPTDLLPLLRE